MDKNTVAIIVITYNQEKFVSQTLDSLLAQKCDFPYKIIINDDCSTDGTSEVLLSYANKWPQLIDLQLNPKNLGVVDNYFDAVNRSDSEFITNCAGDDWWCDEYKLQKQVDFMQIHSECGYLYTGYKQFVDGVYRNMPLVKRDKFDDFIIYGNSVPAVTVCYRRSLCLRYQEEIQPLSHDWGMEDQPMVLWFSLNSKIMCIQDVTAVYRIVQGSAYHSDIDKAIRLSQRSYQLCKYFVEKFNREDLLLQVQKKNVTTMVYKYLSVNCPVDKKICDKVHKIGVMDGKLYLLYVLSKIPFLRRKYSKKIVF